MKRAAVLNVAGLTLPLISKGMPQLESFVRRGAAATIAPAFPAVTCTAQANYLTGSQPERHGIVGNGWYDRQLAEVHFWKQSNHLVCAAKIWDALRGLDPKFTCAQLFWWFNMYSGADYSITPRPMYPADGRKIFDVYSWPFPIRHEIKRDLGEFPFPAFWGPAAGVDSTQFKRDAASRWIAKSAEWIERKYQPVLSLVYLPHLDYSLQRLGPRHPGISEDLRRIDSIAGELIAFFQDREVQVIVLSEYGLEEVNTPVHLNRIFRRQGWLAIKEELGLELLDCGASKVFAVADHQIAHIYLNDRTLEKDVTQLLASTPGIEQVLDESRKQALGVNHERAGDLVAVASQNAWFTYYYWLDDSSAPDFARTVDIHRKPGYDPVELFLDPRQPWIKAKILRRLFQKKLGFRMLMDVVPLDATLVKGSHGRADASASAPILAVDKPHLLSSDRCDSTDVFHIIRNAVAKEPDA
jgi:predicted AlkP superfamily pyrophosphatase or phosphodiesterase